MLAQTPPPDQIVVVNDGSTDDTEQIVKSYGDRITLINKANGGKSSALNLAWHNAGRTISGSVMTTIWPHQWAGVPRHCAGRASEAGFAFGDLLTFRDENGQRSYEAPGYRYRREETDLKVLFFEQMITCQFAMLVRRSLYDKNQPLPRRPDSFAGL